MINMRINVTVTKTVLKNQVLFQNRLIIDFKMRYLSYCICFVFNQVSIKVKNARFL